MAKLPTTNALAVVTSHELKAKDSDLEFLQKSVVAQLGKMSGLRQEESLRGLLVGMALYRIKASLPHGQFGKWCKSAINGTYGERYVNYLMKLALIFVEKCKVRKPELLALPGDQTELALDGMEGDQRRFTAKAIKFVGDLSLNELFIEHDIKPAGSTKNAKKKKPGGGDTSPAKTPQELCIEILETLELARKDACDKAVWMRMSRAQHDDIKHAFEEAGKRIAALHSKTHGRKATR